MLGAICQEIRNYFCTAEDIYTGTFTISGGVITPSDFLTSGQYFRIRGSRLNEGVFLFSEKLTFGGSPLKDEIFTGEIWAMSVPQDVVELDREIEAWRKKYGDASRAPYTSENFGGYSYSMRGSTSWRSIFASELNRWRKANAI